ncbi:hypothetical protein Tco_0656403 [Tanacetum coccineum]|uniref:Uncharacterized protein n=1 Tax=Tanacetum coccineum TaxID=301880 RepID=A0ABQ4X8R7_9ASTR
MQSTSLQIEIVMEQRPINVVKVHTDDKDYTLDSIHVRSSHSIGSGGKQSTSPHSKGLQVYARDGTMHLILKVLLNLKGLLEIQRTADFQECPQTSGGDEGLLEILLLLNIEVRDSRNKHILKLNKYSSSKSKAQEIVQFVLLWSKIMLLYVNQKLKKQKRRRKKHKKQVSSVKLGRNKDEGILSEEHKVQEEDLAHPFFDDTADQDAAVTPNLERKSDETEEVNIEEKEASNVKSGETEELDLETTQSTARQGTITPRILNFEEEAGPSSPLRQSQVMEPEEQLKAAEVLVSISRPRGLSIPGPIQTQPQQPTQGTDSKDKGKGILVEEPKKKKLTLQQIRALETTNDEEVARKIQAEWDAEEERKRFEELKKTKPKTTLRKPTSLAQERNQMMSFLKVIERKGKRLRKEKRKILVRKRKATISEENYPSRSLRMLDHGMEVEDESETAITLIHLFILWTTEDGDDS